MTYWAVAQTTPNMEERVAGGLARIGYDTCLPKFSIKRIVKGKRKTVPLLVFRGYVFFRMVGSWWTARDTPYVSRVLMESDEARPAKLPDGYVDKLRQAMAEHGGYLPIAKARKFMSGQSVRVVTNGHPMQGIGGLYEGQTATDRARVLMEILGRSVPIEFDERDLIAA